MTDTEYDIGMAALKFAQSRVAILVLTEATSDEIRAGMDMLTAAQIKVNDIAHSATPELRAKWLERFITSKTNH